MHQVLLPPFELIVGEARHLNDRKSITLCDVAVVLDNESRSCDCLSTFNVDVRDIEQSHAVTDRRKLLVKPISQVFAKYVLREFFRSRLAMSHELQLVLPFE